MLAARACTFGGLVLLALPGPVAAATRIFEGNRTTAYGAAADLDVQRSELLGEGLALPAPSMQEANSAPAAAAAKALPKAEPWPELAWSWPVLAILAPVHMDHRPDCRHLRPLLECGP